jgi:hypothetical protein
MGRTIEILAQADLRLISSNSLSAVLINKGGRKVNKFLVVALSLVIISGCASGPSQPTYLEQVAALPRPTSEAERENMCSKLRAEIARVQNMAAYGSAYLQPNFAMYAQMAARNNVAALEAKAAEFRCSAAFAERNPPSAIEACVATCRANTFRTPLLRRW